VPTRKLNPLLKHRIVTFSGLGKLTQSEIAKRLSLVHTSPVAIGLISQQTISAVCLSYRQKRIEDEQLFSLSDVKMMTGIKGQKTILRLAKRERLGTMIAKHRVYKQTDIDRILELTRPPEGSLSAGEVQRLFSISPRTLQRWKSYMGIEPENRFGIAYYSPAQIVLMKESVERGKLGLTLKRLAREANVSRGTLGYWAKKKGWGKNALNYRFTTALFLAQGEYSEALSFLRSRALQRVSPESADGRSEQP